MKKGFFTLIELLLVISIIAILASLLLPALNNAKKNGQRISCSSAMRQNAMASLSYTLDYNDYFPPTVDYRNGFMEPGMIPQRMLVSLQYVTEKTMKDGCPSYPAAIAKYWNICGFLYNGYMGSINASGIPNTVNCTSYGYCRISKLLSPSRKIMWTDAKNDLWLWFVTIDEDYHIGWWHSNGANFAFFDGHIKYNRISDFSFDLINPWGNPAFSENKKLLYPDQP